MYEHHKYLIFSVSQLPLVNFDEVLETSADTVRISVDGLSTFVNWEGETPASINQLTNTLGPYTHSEILEIMSSDVWSTPQEGI